MFSAEQVDEDDKIEFFVETGRPNSDVAIYHLYRTTLNDDKEKDDRIKVCKYLAKGRELL